MKVLPKTAADDDGWSRETKEDMLFTWTRRFLLRDEPADLLLIALKHEYDLPGDNYQEQRDLFLEVYYVCA